MFTMHTVVTSKATTRRHKNAIFGEYLSREPFSNCFRLGVNQREKEVEELDNRRSSRPWPIRCVRRVAHGYRNSSPRV
mgnify:CR=1 FL=1